MFRAELQLNQTLWKCRIFFFFKVYIATQESAEHRKTARARQVDADASWETKSIRSQQHVSQIKTGGVRWREECVLRAGGSEGIFSVAAAFY